jgi:L-ascorbate metabolism protein UlaG (beta-lactamase superfamily)
LCFENDRLTVLVDPYLTDSLGDVCEEKKRRIAVDETLFDISPDVVLITHSHPDHLDVATLDRFLKKEDKKITVLASGTAYEKLMTLGYRHNIVLLSPHSVWSEGGVTFYAVKAEHTERDAIGFIIDDAEKTYYVSGDTLYNFDVIDDCLDLVEDGVDYAFLPINGCGNNMNAKDAADFAYEIGANTAVPVHYGLFDDVDPEDFDFEDRLVLKPYEKIEL